MIGPFLYDQLLVDICIMNHLDNAESFLYKKINKELSLIIHKQGNHTFSFIIDKSRGYMFLPLISCHPNIHSWSQTNTVTQKTNKYRI